MKPVLRHIANLWTLMEYPSREREWSLDEKLRAIQEADFDGVCWAPSPELHQAAARRGLIFVGGMASACEAEFPSLLAALKRYGAHHVNVQLGSDRMLTPEALRLALSLMAEAKRLDLEPAIESHRGTSTETPKKTYALADAYLEATGELLPISWDFSHFAVVKHLVPGEFAERLLVRPELIQHAQHFHFRPFNGHHAQIPITCRERDPEKTGGKPIPEIQPPETQTPLTQETLEWLPFAEAVLRCWLEGNRDRSREIFICPELGPVVGGYALSTFPDSWEDAKVLRREIDLLWRRLNAEG